MRIEYAEKDKNSAFYREAKFRAKLAKMDTKKLVELQKIYSELLARYQAKKPPSRTKPLTEKMRERVSVYRKDSRIGTLIHDTDLTVAKSYLRALGK